MEIHCLVVLFLGVFSSTIGSTLKPKPDVNLEDTVAFLEMRSIQTENRVLVLESRETGDLLQRLKDEIQVAVQDAEAKSLQWKNELLVKIEEVETESKNRRNDLSEKLQELEKRVTEVGKRCKQSTTDVEEKLRHAEHRWKKADNHLLTEVLRIKPMLKEVVEKVHTMEMNSVLHSVDLIRKNMSLLTDNLRLQLNESLNFGLENMQTILTRNSRILEEIETRSVVLDDIPDMKKALTNHSIQLDTLNEHLSCIKSSGDKAVTPVDGEALGPPPDTSDAPDLCQNGSIDTITRTRDGRTYVFKGDFYWKIVSTGIADGYPRKISDDWDGLEGNLDASLSWFGKTFFFKGGHVWRFTNKEMDSGYPRFIRQEFPGIPDNLDAACVWNGNAVPYFFRGDQYWRFLVNNVPQVTDGYPAAVSWGWHGLPESGVDAAFQWEDGRTYFFKGDKYYRFDVKLDTVPSPPYPRSTSAWWFGCKADPDTEYPTDPKRDHN